MISKLILKWLNFWRNLKPLLKKKRCRDSCGCWILPAQQSTCSSHVFTNSEVSIYNCCFFEKWYFVTVIVLTLPWTIFSSLIWIFPGYWWAKKWIKKKFCKFEAEGQGFVIFLRFAFPGPSVPWKNSNYTRKNYLNSVIQYPGHFNLEKWKK